MSLCTPSIWANCTYVQWDIVESLVILLAALTMCFDSICIMAALWSIRMHGMSSMKKRAREKRTGRFASCEEKVAQAEQALPKRKPRRPRKKVEQEKETYKMSITISIRGGDVPVELMHNINTFFVEECLAGKCSLERDGAAYHLHYQMVVRIQAISLISVSRLLKQYLDWDKNKPTAGVVISKRLTNKGLHTFHGILGYCMKDAEKDHYQTIDHNITSADLALGLEQLALHGQEECKACIMLTQRNFAQKCLQWRRWNYKHPAVADWEKEFYMMLKTGKYFPCTSWVIGTFGKGYEPHRMQSYWRMLVSPTTITPEDVNAVFCQPDEIAFPVISQRQRFQHRWEDAGGLESEKKMDAPADESIAEILLGMKVASEEKKNLVNVQSMEDILVHTPGKGKGKVYEGESSKRRGKKGSSPRRELWQRLEDFPDEPSSGFESGSESDLSGHREPALAFGEFSPVYKRSKIGLYVS